MLAPSCAEKPWDPWVTPKCFTGCPRITYKDRRSLAAGNLFGPLSTARRCRRGPDRRHAMRGERRASCSVPAAGIAILRRAVAPAAPLFGRFRPGNTRQGCGPMRSGHNRKRQCERPTARISKRYSDPFERVRTSGIAGSPSAPGDPRRTFESLIQPARCVFFRFGWDFSGTLR